MPRLQPNVDKEDSMDPDKKDETPLFAQLIEERGFNPFALSTGIAKEITSATRTMKETMRGNTHHSPRDVAQ